MVAAAAPPRTRMATQWVEGQRKLNALPLPKTMQESYVQQAPDGWIDQFLSGREIPSMPVLTAQPSAVRVELPAFSGRALDWFGWIDLFYALVHQTSKYPAEKLAILKERVRNSPAEDLVYGLGGGEAAYKEALRRMKQRFGRRDVIRAAHLQALEKMEFPKGDPASFLR